MNTIAERLVFLRGNATQAEFADRIGINVNTLRGYEKGRALPGYEVLETLCTRLNVSPHWILTGQGNVLQETAFPALPDVPQACETPRPVLAEPSSGCEVDLIMVPLVEARLSAGHGSLEVSGSSDRSYAFRSDFLHRKGNPRSMVLMRVSGDSMEPEIRHGDMALIDQSKQQIFPHTIYAVGVNEEIYIKQIETLPGHRMLLRSLNKRYDPIEVDLRGDMAESVRIIGKVIWWCREV